MISKEQIKELLSEFIVNNNHNDFFLKGEEMQLNQSIYEIQYHLAEELERNKINTQLDSRIISDSILKSFRNRLAKCYKPEAYILFE